MMTFGRITTLAAAAVLAAGMWGANPATAASLDCSDPLVDPDVSLNVTPNIGCEVLTSADNDSNEAVSGMFGIADWNRIAKVEPLPGADPAGDPLLTISGDDEGGTWSIAQSVLDTYENVMLIFKGGNNALPEAVVGYLIQVANGNFNSPFFDIQQGQGPNAGEFKVKEISHVSLYVSNMAPIPLPAAGFLMLGALGGLGLLARRRRRAA